MSDGISKCSGATSLLSVFLAKETDYLRTELNDMIDFQRSAYDEIHSQAFAGAHHSALSNDEVLNTWSYTSTP
jgi:hypothetical protein